MDQEFSQVMNSIAAHPNENTASIYLNVHDLTAILEENGHNVTTLAIE